MTTLAAFDDFLDSVPQPAAGPPGSHPPAATPAAKKLLNLDNVALRCVFSHLGVRDLAKVACASHRCKAVAQQDQLWARHLNAISEEYGEDGRMLTAKWPSVKSVSLLGGAAAAASYLRDKWRAMEKERVWVNLDSEDELEEGTEGN